MPLMIFMLLGRRLLFLPLLLAAAAGPVLLSEQGWSRAKEKLSSFSKSNRPAEDAAFALTLPDPADAELPGLADPLLASSLPGSVPSAAAPLEGLPVQELTDVFRFDISPRWVIERWPRVSTIPANREIEGLRVPLVTGPQVHDLAGSLTYYFDRYQQVQRITFHGHTGDERKLAAVVGQYYGLRSSPALGIGLYLATWNGAPTSVLRVKRAAVVRADAPHTQLEVLLELNRPGMRYGLSAEARQLLEQDRQLQRW